MKPEPHELPQVINLQPEWFASLPVTVLLHNAGQQAEFRTPVLRVLNPINNWPFSRPEPLLLNLNQVPFSITYRQAMRILHMEDEKRRLIKAILLPPFLRPFFLLKVLIFNLLERIFPSRSSTGTFIKKLRRKYE